MVAYQETLKPSIWDTDTDSCKLYIWSVEILQINIIKMETRFLTVGCDIVKTMFCLWEGCVHVNRY